MLVESPKAPRQRITITPPVIAAARQVVVLVTGRDKAPAVARALDGDAPSPSEVPARSEERRVGKECMSRWGPDYMKENSENLVLDRIVNSIIIIELDYACTQITI